MKEKGGKAALTTPITLIRDRNVFPESLSKSSHWPDFWHMAFPSCKRGFSSLFRERSKKENRGKRVRCSLTKRVGHILAEC